MQQRMQDMLTLLRDVLLLLRGSENPGKGRKQKKKMGDVRVKEREKERKRRRRKENVAIAWKRYKGKKKANEQHNNSSSNGNDAASSRPNSMPSSGNSGHANSSVDEIMEKLESINLLSDDFDGRLKEIESEARKHYIGLLAVDDGGENHRAPVCVVCDRFIIKHEDLNWVEKKNLLQHGVRLSRAEYEIHHSTLLPDSLKEQYMVEDSDLKHLLLSPRAGRKDDSYMCCSSCKTSLRPHLVNTAPPRNAIANGFVIGKVPDEVVSEDEITDVLAAMIAPVRPFMHVVSYTGGQHKTIKGNVTFFQNSVFHTASVLNNYLKTGANPNVYCVLCGRFTPKQREIVQKKMKLDLRSFKRLVQWFVTDSNHEAFAEVDPDMENWPQPVVLESSANQNNTDEEEDVDVESTTEGTRYYFPSAHQPNSQTANCHTQQEFARSMMNGTAPTLLFLPGDYENERNTPIENIFPLVFPYGTGGFRMKHGRRNRMSMEATMEHYLGLSLAQFHRPDFVLAISSMLMRSKAFNSGIIKCRTKERGVTLAEKFSRLTEQEVALAADRADTGLNAGGTAGRFLSAVSTSCRPLGHSNEAAEYARRQFMAYCDRFGMPNLFVTVTPDDSMSFRIKVFARSGQTVPLPSFSWSDEECVLDLAVREKIRTSYPGLCSLDFQSLMDFMWKFLIGWDVEKMEGRHGIFGKPIAACETDEEQGRKTLHSHWLVWIENFNFVRFMLYHENGNVREKAESILKSYVSRTMCASYGSGYEISHACKDDVVKTETVENAFESLPNQVIRDARHQDHCFSVCGKCPECMPIVLLYYQHGWLL